jgi:hypothetical protein
LVSGRGGAVCVRTEDRGSLSRITVC